MKQLLGFVVAATAMTVSAATVEYIGTATSEKSASASDITNPTKWGDGAHVVSAGNDYVIAGGRFCGFGGDGTFPGDSITLGSASEKGNLEVRSSSAFSYDFKKIVFNYGEIYSAQGGVQTIGGDVTVNATEQRPADIKHSGAWGGGLKFTGSIGGSGNLRLYKTAQTSQTLHIWLLGDMSGFTGLLDVAHPSDKLIGYYFTPVLIAGGNVVDGTVRVNTCGDLAISGADGDYYGDLTVKNLEFKDQAMYSLSFNVTTGATIRVTNSLTLPESGKVRVEIRNFPDVSNSFRRYPILVFPAGTAVSESQFELYGNGSLNIAKLSACSLSVDDYGPGERALYVEMQKFTYQAKKDDWSSRSWKSSDFSHWRGRSDGETWDAETVYVDSDYLMVTDAETGYFGGKRLVLYSAAASLMFGDSRVTIPDLVMGAKSSLQIAQSSACLKGKITVERNRTADSPDQTQSKPADQIYGPAVIRGGLNLAITIESDIQGPGDLQVVGDKDLSSTVKDGRVLFRLAGQNGGFKGSLLVDNSANHAETNTTVAVTDGAQLGGSPDLMTYDAVHLKNWSRLQAESLVVVDAANRGVYFDGNNFVSVPDETNALVLATQTTFDGRLVKEGAGTLALGGVAKFSSSQSDTPVSGKNELEISAGWLRPVSKLGADGLAVSFAQGTGLRFAPFAESDADVKNFGFYDVKWPTPFDLSQTDGKLLVAVDAGGLDSSSASFAFAVCTVSAAAAESLDLENAIELPRVRGYRGSVSGKSNADGSVTYCATYERQGMLLIFR